MLRLRPDSPPGSYGPTTGTIVLDVPKSQAVRLSLVPDFAASAEFTLPVTRRQPGQHDMLHPPITQPSSREEHRRNKSKNLKWSSTPESNWCILVGNQAHCHCASAAIARTVNTPFAWVFTTTWAFSSYRALKTLCFCHALKNQNWLIPKDSNLEPSGSEPGASTNCARDQFVPRGSVAQPLGTVLQRTNTCYRYLSPDPTSLLAPLFPSEVHLHGGLYRIIGPALVARRRIV